MLGMRASLAEAGDTIVEVMIVLAVLGLSIGIAYATANRSLLNARQAQESAEATSLAQSQVEQLRAASADPATKIFNTSPTTYFCFDTSGTYQPFSKSNPTLTTTSGDYPSGCQQGNIPYYISINYDNSSDDTFTVKAVWDDVLGEGQDSTTIIYKVHQP